MGYHRAGFDVVGVDNRPQPHYPFRFIQADALAFMRELGNDGPRPFVAIHASPPCQAYSKLRVIHKREHPDLVAPTREALLATGLPFVIENVIGAPLVNAYVLCGGGLGLGTGGRHLVRHRLFECHGFDLGLVPPCSHFGRQAIGVYGRGRWDNSANPDRGGYQGSAAECADAMGIDWMNRDEVAQAIPPAMTELVGERLLQSIAMPALIA
jgi:DNA (cytosine-5)-methyltransferase 1